MVVGITRQETTISTSQIFSPFHRDSSFTEVMNKLLKRPDSTASAIPVVNILVSRKKTAVET